MCIAIQGINKTFHTGITTSIRVNKPLAITRSSHFLLHISRQRSECILILASIVTVNSYLFRTVIHLCLSIDELTQVYTFLTARPVYPKGWKYRWKTHYFHALGFVVEWKKSRTINMKL